jgi:hypothetical protein
MDFARSTGVRSDLGSHMRIVPNFMRVYFYVSRSDSKSLSLSLCVSLSLFRTTHIHTILYFDQMHYLIFI